MKPNLPVAQRWLYYIFYAVSTLLYIGWLLLLSSCSPSQPLSGTGSPELRAAKHCISIAVPTIGTR